MENTALNQLIDRIDESLELLEIIKAELESHMEESPEDINWGHVGSAGHVLESHQRHSAIYGTCRMRLYPGDKMERKEIDEMVQMPSSHRAGDKYIVNGMVEFADVAGSTQGVWQWDGRYSPTIMPAELLTDKQRDLILETAIEQVNEAAS